eukprot:12547486-Alexandrium_andersonii.AAC.1
MVTSVYDPHARWNRSACHLGPPELIHIVVVHAALQEVGALVAAEVVAAQVVDKGVRGVEIGGFRRATSNQSRRVTS